MAVFKRRCSTQRLLAAIIVLSAAVVAGKGGAGSGTMVIGELGSGQRHAVDQLSARDLPNVHGAHCVINPIDAKVQFPALSLQSASTCGAVRKVYASHARFKTRL